MTILTRYMAREFTKNFFVSLGAFSATYLIVDFFERINAFMVNHASPLVMGIYFLNRIPAICFQVAPPAVLLSSLVTLGFMSRHNEIVAMKSGGIGLWRITLPILGVVLLIYLGLLGINEWVVPRANERARVIRERVINRKESPVAFKRSQIWIHRPQAIYNIQLYRPEKKLLEGITLYFFDSRNRLLKRVDARSAHWEGGKWIFVDASVTLFPPKGLPTRKNYPELVLPLPERPEDLLVAEKNPNEMGFGELRDYTRKIEQEGYDASAYRSAMHASLSRPFTAVILALIGIPLALRKQRSAGLARGLGLSILISFVYLLIFSFGLDLGTAGTLPPFVSAWLGNFIFALIGFYLFLSIRH
jgi:lipopolysaccharide export system permease protein